MNGTDRIDRINRMATVPEKHRANWKPQAERVAAEVEAEIAGLRTFAGHKPGFVADRSNSAADWLEAELKKAMAKFDCSEIDSTALAWKHRSEDPMESERFWWEPWTWDVAKAKRILEEVPHPIVKHDITDTIALLSVVDVADSGIQSADLSFPVIVGQMDDKMLVIDGWSRIAKAASQGTTHLPAIILTEEENQSIIDSTAKFDDDWDDEEDGI